MVAARSGGRTVAALAAAVVLLVAAPARAAWSASATGTTTAATGSWAVVAVPSGATAPGPVQVRRNAPAYLEVRNAGTLEVALGRYDVVAPVPVSLEICAEPWDARRGRCAPGAVTVEPGVATAAVPATPGAVLHLRVSTTSNTRSDAEVQAAVRGDGVRPPVAVLLPSG